MLEVVLDGSQSTGNDLRQMKDRLIDTKGIQNISTILDNVGANEYTPHSLNSKSGTWHPHSASLSFL